MAQSAEQLICNQQVIGSSPIVGFFIFIIVMGGFPSGQRGQTVNLLATLSKVRILLRPLSRGRAVRQLVGLITRRSQVQILSPQVLASVAQLVEQRTENPCVAGSIPARGIRQVTIVYESIRYGGLFFIAVYIFLINFIFSLTDIFSCVIILCVLRELVNSNDSNKFQTVYR